MPSHLSLSTANSLNRRPVKSESSPLNPKNLPVVDCTRPQHGESHIKRERRHHGEERAQRTPHQAEGGRVAKKPIKQERRNHHLSTQPTLDLYTDDSANGDTSASASDSASENDSASDNDSETDDDEKAHASQQKDGMLIDLRRGHVHTEQENADIQKLLLLPEIDIPPDQRKKTPRAMACTLMEHQKVCLTWLCEQEQDNHKKGGLLADTMGLGKTVQALSLILARPSRDPAFKTTLVVAPVALLKQWEREIQTKVKAPYKLKTYILHGPVQRGMSVSKLLSYDVVLTTYGKIAAEYKVSPRRKTRKRPLLLASDARFYRIILDEAHNIKNRRSVRSLAVCQLKATYRLCMTGTPFMNDVEEIFSLVRFLRISPYNSWEWFNEDIAKPVKRWDEDERSGAMVKLQVLFRSITLRRTKTSVLDGKQIIHLPELTIEKSDVEFDKDQRAFYDALENKQRIEFNKYLRINHDFNYAYILTLLLRLRQACCHPHLIKDQCIPDGTQLDPEDMIDLALKLKEPVIARIKSQREFQCPICNTQTENPIINYPCGHHLCGACFTTMMEMRHLGASLEDVPEPACPQHSCSAKIDPDKVLCYYYFREAHMEDESEAEANGHDDDDLDENRDGYKHEDDVDAQGNLKGFVVSDDHDGEKEEESAREDEENKDPDLVYTSHSSVSETSETFEPTDENETKDTQYDEPAEGETDDDSDNDSLPSLEQIRQKVFGEKLLAKGQPTQTNDRISPDSDSDSESEIETRQVTTSKGKRNRSPDDETDEPRKKAKTSTKQRRISTKGKTFKSMAALKKEASNNVAAKAQYLKRLRKDFVSSAKIDKTLEVLRTIRDQSPGEKTLVFSLWTSFLDLLEIPIHDEGIRYTRYDGSMHPKDRDDAVSAFMEKPEVEVMLVSLMAGNAGLNLTAATQVIILEPFWNPFVEDQAIDRTHRIGQKHPVTVHRVLIAGTVEDRIQDLQEKKRKLVSAALSEEGAETSSRLTQRELMGLFGIRRP